MNRLIEQFYHSSNGLDGTGSPATPGDGIVNGTRMRSAIYNMLDILQNNNSITKEEVSFKNNKICYIAGRDLTKLKVYGNTNGVGYLDTSDNKYYIDVLILPVNQREGGTWGSFSHLLTNGPLYEGDYVEIDLTAWTLPAFPFDIYKIELKQFSTDVEIFYTATRDHYTPNVDDYIYETFGENNEYIKTLSYVGSDTELIIPEHFTSLNDTLKTLGEFTFYKTDVKRVGIPEGVETIE